MAEQTDVSIDLHGEFGYQKVHVHTSKVLGTGSYGSVVRATLDHLPCAAKILHNIFFKINDPGASDFAARFDQECRILRDLKHPCIVQFLGVVQDPRNRRPILLMELMEEALTGFLESSPTPLPYHVQVNITHDIALALAYLHANNILHRDLSSNNILLNAGSQAKVTDFGMSRMMEANLCMIRNKITQCPGTPVFMPPEALRSNPRYSDKLDTFSAGVLIIQIITRTFPAPADANIVMEDPSSPTGEKIIPVLELERRKKDIDMVPTDHSLLPIACHCLKDRDKERPTAAQLCQSLDQLKATKAYEDSKAAEHQRRFSLEQQSSFKEEESAAEIARLQKQVRKLEKKHKQKSKEKEKENDGLRCPPQSAQTTPAKQQKITAAIRKVSKPEDEKELYQAARSGDVETVKRLVAANVNVDCTPLSSGGTPLMAASYVGRVDVVKTLIGSQAQVNTHKEDGWTALHLAAHEGKVDVVILLAEAGAQFNIQTEDGRTALYISCSKGHVRVVQLLLQKHADVSICKKDGWSPLMTASFEGHVEVVRALIVSQALVNTQNEDGQTALYISCREGHVAVVQLLLKKLADVSICNKNGSTPLYIASQEGHTDVVDTLIGARASVNQACLKHRSIPLHIAAQKGHVDTVKRLVEGESNINYQNKAGVTPLFSASKNGNTEVVDYLIRAGVNINLAHTDGRRPIDIARANGHSDIVCLLKRRNK